MEVANDNLCSDILEQSQNTAHTITIMHSVETNGWKKLDHSQRWIEVGN